jgi:hypothetical protein
VQEMVKVAEIVENATSSVDFGEFDGSVRSWKTLLMYKLGDRQVPALIRAIQTEGFNVPIYLDRDDPDEWIIGNGHHRLSVAILLGMDEVPVTDIEYDSDLSRTRNKLDSLPEDDKGAQIIADMIETAIDWDSWDNWE